MTTRTFQTLAAARCFLELLDLRGVDERRVEINEDGVTVYYVESNSGMDNALRLQQLL